MRGEILQARVVDTVAATVPLSGHKDGLGECLHTHPALTSSPDRRQTWLQLT